MYKRQQYLVLGAKALAVLDGRLTPLPEDVRRVALPVLRHRVVTSFAADAEGLRADDVLRRILEGVAA